jgi:glutathione synthase/RimK-type ligase-like ATP-grasp enzyme
MILLCGIPSETPLAIVAEALSELGACFVVLNQREIAQWDVRFDVTDDGLSGWLQNGGETVSLADIAAVYVRLIDFRELPEFAANPSLQETVRARHDRLLRWLDVSPARILNRPEAMASNASKPYQCQLIEASGLTVPPTLITTDPLAVEAFHRRHDRLIYKSISSIRSIVREFTGGDRERLASIRWCPTQFQALIDGVNVRVHVVGDAVFATEILSEAPDYRYAAAETGVAAELRPCDLDPALEDRCRTLARDLDLPLAGIDLKFAPDGRVFCFEVNPSPAFSYYESHTGQPISRAIATFLQAASHPAND